MFKKSIFLFTIYFAMFLNKAYTQVYEVHPPDYIQTIQFKGDTELGQLPILKLGANINLSFDDLQADEKNYYYRIKHYNFDWTPSSISKNEYLEGFDESRIKNYANSQNTLQAYSHFQVQIPNSDLKGLKISGNYIIEILDNKQKVVFSRKFMLIENLVNLEVEVKRTRNLSYVEKYQSIRFKINSPNMVLNNPTQNVKTVVLQNSNLHNAINDLKPQHSIGNELLYRYDLESSFPGGNEYLYFDSKDVKAIGSGIGSVKLAEVYNHYLGVNRVRKNNPYTRNPDINGNFLIRSLDKNNQNIEAEYTRVHFALKYEEKLGKKEIHLYGNFNNFMLDDSTQLLLNPNTGLYEGSKLFKQGFYNYKFVIIDEDGYIDESAIDGDFWQTENEYTVLAYYRAPGERYDRIIGIGNANSTSISN